MWSVNGEYVRDHVDGEFTNFGQHYMYPRFIPTHTFWIDKERVPNEGKFYVYHMLKEWQLMRRGYTAHDADTIASRYEQKIRDNQNGIIRGKSSVVPKKTLWKTVDGVKVYIVDGKAVRDHLYVKWTEGGHGYQYSFIPNDEVWIDNDLKRSEWQFTLTHELLERSLMMKGMKYDPAHRRATIREHEERTKEAA